MRWNRTMTAGLVLAAAVTLPCTAWYVGGSRAVEREAQQLLAAPALEARSTAVRLAERLRGRLDAIRDAESRRPYYEYSHRFADLSGDCACAPIIDSPLARGPDEHFLWTHFEIDRTGRVSLPTLPEDDLEATEAQSAILAKLRRSTIHLTEPVWKGPRPPRPDFSRSAGESDAVLAGARAEVVVYGDTEALVEPFAWYTVEVAGEPSLVAMRRVRDPAGRRIQGFVVSNRAVESSLDAPALDASFRPAAGDEDDIAESLGLAGAEWEVHVHAGEAMETARDAVDSLRRRFVGTFVGGSSVAILAAVFVVGLVGQTERLAKQRARFAASAAHELRTPLAGLRVYGEMLADGLGDPAQSRTYARQVAAEAERLGRVVSNVLGYTRLERGATVLKPEPGDLGEAVRDGSERLRAAVETAGASLHVDLPAELPRVRFDADAVFQIVQNLVDNAERYGREAGDRSIQVRIEPEPGGLVLSVADRGPGIGESARRKLFRPFERGHEPDAPAGLGLGLAIVHSLVEAHGGTVRHAENPGGGSVFRVTFPLDA